MMEYKSSKVNQVADALSRKTELKALKLDMLNTMGPFAGYFPRSCQEGLRARLNGLRNHRDYRKRQVSALLA